MVENSSSKSRKQEKAESEGEKLTVLATVPAQAQMLPQALYSSSSPNPFPHPHPSPLSPVPLQQRIGPASEDVFLPEAEQPSSSDQKAQAAHIVVKTTSSDGFNWRKYGQKQVKSSETFRSYYRCTHTICSAKKKVEHCQDGRVTETIYRGQHNHDLPQKPKCSKERGSKSAAHSGENETLAIPSGENDVDPSPFKAEQNSSNEAPEQQFHCSSDCEGDTGIKTDKDTCDEPEPKRRISESPLTRPAPLLKTVRESKIVVQTACDGGLVSDGYRWRKYGQKIVKGNPNPRSYFKCTHLDCPVRKHVERASKDEKAVIVTYEGKHNHDLPTPKIAAMTSDGYLETSNSSSDQQMRAESQPYTTDGETAGEKALEVGGEKELESAQTLLSIGYNSSSEKNDEGNNSDAIQPPLFNENCAAVAVQNS